MTLPAAVGVLAALALILGVMALLVRLAQGVQGRGFGSEGPELRVEARTGLAPRQGIALVRVRDRELLVSFGDGGVRLLSEMEGPEVPAPRQEAHAGPSASAPPRGFPALLNRAVAATRRASVLLLVALGAQIVPGPQDAAPLSRTGVLGVQPLAAQVQEGSPNPAAPEAAGPAPSLTDAVLPALDLRVGRDEEEALRLSGPVGTVIFIGFLTLIPTLLLLMTSFTRILIVLHLLKQAIGTQTAPPAHLLTAMALLLTAFVMAPTMEEANSVALRPWLDGEIDEAQMLRAGAVPFREFMVRTTREEDLVTFLEMQDPDRPAPETVDDVPMVVLASAFVTSELRAAFQMGFALFLPFVVIDVVVASVLMSMGMFMLPPMMVSLPFKLLLFVLVDGWALVMGSLVQSFS